MTTRIETLEFIAGHAKEATAILSEHPAVRAITRAGQSLPEAVQTLCDHIERQAALLDDIRNKIEQEHTSDELIAYIYGRIGAVLPKQ